MPVVNRSKAVTDSVLLIRDLVLNNVTDPLGASRTGTSKFVMTGWPKREAQYPIITVEQQGWSTRPLGTNTTETLATLRVEVNVWSKARRECDQLAGSVIAIVEQNQALTRASGLFDMRFESVTGLDEPGRAGVHRKVMEATYVYPSQP